MYVCDSGHFFEYPKRIEEKHGFDFGHGEIQEFCKRCGSEAFEHVTDIEKRLENEMRKKYPEKNPDSFSCCFLKDEKCFIMEVVGDDGEIEDSFKLNYEGEVMNGK